MKKLLVLGDFFNGLADLSIELKEDYTLKKIAFIDLQSYPNPELPKDWKIIDFRDFHELTIETIEFEPEIVIYLSPFNRKFRSTKFPEEAEIANIELLEHLRQTIDIHDSHLIILVPKLRIETLNDANNILQLTIQEGREMIKGMKKHSFVHYPEILDHSPEGYGAFLKNTNLDNSQLKQIDEEEIITISKLKEKLIKIIENNVYGEIILEGINLTMKHVETIKNVDFRGKIANFNLRKPPN